MGEDYFLIFSVLFLAICLREVTCTQSHAIADKVVPYLPRNRCTWWLRPCTRGTSFDTPPPPPAEDEDEERLPAAASSEAAIRSDDAVRDERDL